MKQLFFAFAFLAAGVLSAAPELVVAEKGKSPYTIVYADSDPELRAMLKTTAETLQRIVQLSTEALLPAVPESTFKGNSPAIFVGRVKALKNAAPEKRWAGHIRVKGKNIFLWGEDRKFAAAAGAPYRTFILGSHHAALLFAQKFAGAVFLIPPDLKYSIPRTGKITVPADFSCDRIPHVQYCISRGKSIDYDLGNNFRAAPWNRTFGGHSHPEAIPWKKYEKTHPEYFFVPSPGKPRYCYRVRPQYCLSNPEVKELIYKQLLCELDKGYEQTQLGQSDSFHTCYCEACVKDRGKLSAGERLWQIHRDMALRLMKDRPGKRVVILAYGPTIRPPETFKEFPPNTIVELAPCNEKTLEDWRGFKVPKVGYLYNWGYYNFTGFSPNREIAFLAEQTKLFRKYNVIGLYRCGFGELPGLEGPSYYIWGQMLDDPDADSAALLAKYCRQAYGKGGEAMTQFHTVLDEAVKSKRPEIGDWNEISGWNRNINPARRQFLRFDLALLAARYPEKVLSELESLLRKAESQEKTPLLKIVRTEFELLKHNARCAAVFRQGMKSRSAADAARLLEAAREREKFIDTLFPEGRKSCVVENVTCFGGASKQVLKTGGRLMSVFNAPFSWDLAAMKKLCILPFGRVLKADGRDTQYLVPRCIDDRSSATVNFERTVQVRAALEGSRLKIFLTRRNFDAASRKGGRIRIKLGPDKAGRHQIFSALGNGAMSDSVPAGIVRDPKILGEQEKWGASAAVRPSVKCPTPDSAEITVPLEKICKKLPAPGDKWLFNVTVYQPHRTYAGGLVWECALDQLDWEQSFEREGVLLFPGKK